MIREGADLATYTDFDHKVRFAEIMTYYVQEKEIYSITVEATEDCPYSLQVTTSREAVKIIKKGTFTDVNLSEGEHELFLFENLINETFKILPLYKNGEVVISAKPIAYEDVEAELMKNYKEMKGWVWNSKDYLRVYNVDFLKKSPEPNYCFDCFYLISVKAERNTEASIVIPTGSSEIAVAEGSTIKDYLMLDEKATYRIFTVSKGSF